MKITQLRNATIVLHSGDYVILVDPMLAPKAAIPSLKYMTSNRRRNPLVELPAETEDILSRVTHCLITHCQKGHFDHLDRAGTKWLRENNIPVYCSDQDAEFLSKKGLDVHVLKSGSQNPFLDGTIDLIQCIHGEGFLGKFMAHGYGFVIKQASAPSVYITGDTILTEEVRHCIRSEKPDWIVLPAGGARFDLGGDIIMGLEEALEVGALSQGQVIANHLESLDHCPVTRKELISEVSRRNWSHRFHVPGDGEAIQLSV
jgi:L-ascorbate metabolism protein UlaG (beta-lactamase superfamily)